jgi:hypothetical protein
MGLIVKVVLVVVIGVIIKLSHASISAAEKLPFN